jgi:hypothetical protein
MPDPTDKMITGITKAGQADSGQGVLFELAYASGDPEMFYCRADMLPRLLMGLNLAGGLAAKTRSVAPGSFIDLTSPVKMTKATRTGQTPDGTIILEFGSDMGFPLHLSMSQDQARQTISLLHAELGRSPPTKQNN